MFGDDLDSTVYDTGYTLGVQVQEPSTDTATNQNLWILLAGVLILWLMGSKPKKRISQS